MSYDWRLGDYRLADDRSGIPQNYKSESVMADPIVWSCGGGTQSAAIAALIVSGDLPKPDVAVIADTGREATETWNYYETVLRPALAEVFVDLVRLDPNEWKTTDLWGGSGKDIALMPMFTNRDGGIGQTLKYCSNEWKSRPIDRYVRRLGCRRGTRWIGFSVDEIHRMRFDPKAAWQVKYPLIDKRMSRADCVALVIRMGWPAPPRSSCWMCPYRSDQEWIHLRRTSPTDFESAIKLEKEVQAKDSNLYFHRSCKPLGSVNFGEAQGDLLDQCGSGMCFT